MAGKESTIAADIVGMPPFFNLGQERTEALAALQKELLEAYEQTSRAWLARVQSEVQLWSDFATKLSKTRSLPEAVEAYTKCLTQQMKMTAEDGKRMLEECQQVTQTITKSLGNGWSAERAGSS